MYGVWNLNIQKFNYIGKSNVPQERFRGYMNGGGNECLQKLVKEKGADSFGLIILEKTSFSTPRGWAKRERFWIKKFRKEGHPLCNKNDGGGGPTEHTEKAKQKNRDWHLKYYETHDGVMKDKKHSEEAKQKSSKSHKKYYETHDQWNKGKFREENPFFGKHHTQETKDDLSQQHKEWHKTNRVSNEPKGMYNKQHTQEAKGKMSDKKKEWHRTHEHPRGFLGRHHTEESRDKTRVSMEEWHQNHECPAAKSYPAFYNEGTGELISSGRNLKRLCRSKNLNYGSMLGVKTGYRKQTNDGWRLAV